MGMRNLCDNLSPGVRFFLNPEAGFEYLFFIFVYDTICVGD